MKKSLAFGILAIALLLTSSCGVTTTGYADYFQGTWYSQRIYNPLHPEMSEPYLDEVFVFSSLSVGEYEWYYRSDLQSAGFYDFNNRNNILTLSSEMGSDFMQVVTIGGGRLVLEDSSSGCYIEYIRE